MLSFQSVKICVFLMLLIFFRNLSAGELQFIENQGQWDYSYQYKAHLGCGNVFLYDDKFYFRLYEEKPDIHDASGKHNLDQTIKGHAFYVEFKGAHQATLSASEKAPEYHNYYLGDQPEKWKTKVGLYKRVLYENLYDGIDMEVYSTETSLKYDYIIQPGADINQLKVVYNGVDDIALINDKLVIKTSVNTMVENIPIAYQWIEGVKTAVVCRYVLKNGIVSFAFPDGYDKTKKLIIDPSLIFSSYSGFWGDNWGSSATYDKDGSMYLTGVALEEDGNSAQPFETAGAFQTNFSGGEEDIVIMKLNPTGTTKIFATYLGGANNEVCSSTIVDPNGEFIIMGATGSFNFPTSSTGFDRSFNRGTNVTISTSFTFNVGTDIFITKFSADGSALIGSTYFGGTKNDGLVTNTNLTYNYGDDSRGDIIIGNNNEIYIASSTLSTDVPITAGAFQNTLAGGQDGLLARFNSDLSNLLSSTYYGGSGGDGCFGIKTDLNGDVVVCGGTTSTNIAGMNGINTVYLGGSADGFLFHTNENFTSNKFATYIGTNKYDIAFLLDIDDDNNIYTFGQTEGNYSVSAGVYFDNKSKQFIHKLNNSLNTTIYSTTFGSKNSSYPNISPTAFLVDKCQNAHAVGWGGSNNGTTTSGMATTTDAFKRTTDGDDFYFITLSKNATSLVYGSYFGENGGLSGDHVDGGTSRFDKNGVVYQAVCASCGGTDGFPTTPGAFSRKNNSSNCNMAGFKFQFDLGELDVLSIDIPSDSGCAPLTIPFSYTSTKPATTFEWDFGDGNTSTDQYPTHTYTTPGIYEVQLILGSPQNCKPFDTGYVKVYVFNGLNPDANFTIDTTQVCNNGLITFTNTSLNGVNYSWNFGDGPTVNNNATTVTHNYASAGTFTVTLIADNPFCFLKDTIKKTVNISQGLVDAQFNVVSPVCIGTTFNLNSTSTNATSIQWILPNGTTSTSNPTSYTPTGTGTFNIQLIAINTTACNKRDTLIKPIIVLDTIHAAFSANTANVCTTGGVVFTNSSTNATSYVWNFGDGQTSTDVSPSHAYSTGGTYTVSLYASNSTMCNSPDTFKLSITVPATVNADYSVIGTSCLGDVITLTNTSQNAVSFKWILPDLTESTTNVLSYTVVGSGTQRILLVATNPNTCNKNDTTFYEFTVGETIDIQGTVSTANVCTTGSVSFNNTSTHLPGNMYFWDFGDGYTFNPAPLGTVTHNYANAGTYDVMLIGINGTACNSPDTFKTTIVVPKTVSASFTSLNASCQNAPIVFNSTSTNADSVRWFFPGGVQYVGNTATHVFNNTGTFTISLVAYNANTCNKTDTFILDIFIRPLLTVDFSFAFSGPCQSTLVDFTNTGSKGLSYNWDFGDGTSSSAENPQHNYAGVGNYNVLFTVTDSNACPTSATTNKPVNILNAALIVADFSHSASPVCLGSSFAFTNSSQNAVSYRWFFGDGDSSQATNPTHTYLQVGQYTVVLIATNSCGISDTTEKTVEVIQIIVQASGSIVGGGCSPATFTTTNTSQNATQYLWIFPDGSTSTEATPIITLVETGNFQITLIASNPAACSISDTLIFNVTVASTPLANFEFSPDFPARGDSILFTNLSVQADSFYWSFGDQTFSTLKNPGHSYATKGLYTICLTAVNKSTGCSDIYCGVIDVKDKLFVFVPTAFSPNGDGLNDLLIPLGNEIASLHFKVFNRWGELLFETNELRKGWDGFYKDKLQNVDVYIYEVTGMATNGETFSTKGMVTLMK